MTPADTASPAFLSAGMLSPVSAASLTAPSPSITTASAGMLSPGRTMKMSPVRISDAGTVCSIPSFTSTAVLGVSAISPFSALVVLPLETASSSLPTVISVTIIAADSK